MIRPILAAAACTVLAACASTIQPDRVTVQEVRTPIAVACSADPGAKPDLADPAAFSAAVGIAPDLFAVAQVYAATVQQLFNWTARLKAANAGCRAQG